METSSFERAWIHKDVKQVTTNKYRSNLRRRVKNLLRGLLTGSVMALCLGPNLALAQFTAKSDGGTAIPDGKFVVSRQNESLQLVVNSSKLLELPVDVARSVIHNDAVVQLQPISRNQLMVSAKATGVTQVDMYDTQNNVHSVQVMVIGDARELEAVLKAEFPTATLSVRPIQNAVILSGQVTSDEHVEQAVAIAEQFYPTVINRIGVIGMHTVMLHTQVLEVSRTKLRELGVDWQFGFGDDLVGQSVSGILSGGGSSASTITSTGTDTFRYGVITNNNRFFTFIRALRQNNLVKVMADPTVVAIDGRPASFNSGGEFPILVPAGLGQVGVEFREFGTRLDFVAKVKGDGLIYLEVRPTISEIDPTRTVVLSGVTVPGLRSRFVDTAVELRAGQTLALAGLLQVRTETQSVGIPGLADIPYLGAAFRANKEVQNEVELLITVTPDFAGPMEDGEVPPGGPGFNSFTPTDKEFYWKGYTEVPNPCAPGTDGSACVTPGMTVGEVQGFSSAATNEPMIIQGNGGNPPIVPAQTTFPGANVGPNPR